MIDPDEYVIVPALLIGKRDSSVQFEVVVVGFSDNGLGFRSRDTRLGLSSVESLLRQPFECKFNVQNLNTDEIIVRIIRIEACRKDPAYLYFGAADFLKISDLDQLMFQSGIKKYEKKIHPQQMIATPLPPPTKK